LSSDTQLLRKKMKIFTVFLVIFILGFDFATPQDNIGEKFKKLRKAINKLGEKLDKQNENGLNKLTNNESQIEDAFNNLNGILTYIQSQNKNGFNTLRNIESLNENVFYKLQYIESQNEDAFNNLNGKLTNIQSQNENGFNKLTNIESQNEAILSDIREQKELTMDVQTKLEKLLIMILDGYTVDPSTGNRYKVIKDTKRSWMEAKVRCERDGAELASIRNDSEWQFVKGILTSSGVTVWLGANFDTKQGKWVWTDGSFVTYTDWRPGQPDGRGDVVMYCMDARTYFSGQNWQWYDFGCTDNISYALCKIPA